MLQAEESYIPTILKGGVNDEGGRFGTAMAPAGDLNNDGYKDVIIGAPYLDNNKGAIFVFHGSENGIDTNPKQVTNQCLQLLCSNTFLCFWFYC